MPNLDIEFRRFINKAVKDSLDELMIELQRINMKLKEIQRDIQNIKEVLDVRIKFERNYGEI